MFGSQMLDVAIGLIFIYLLLSLMVTAVNELIAAWLKRRPATLWRGVAQLLGSEEAAKKLYAHPLIAGITDTSWFAKHRDNLPFKKRPSYLPTENFTLALLDLLAPATGAAKANTTQLETALTARLQADPNDPLARPLAVLLEEAGGDIEKFRAAVGKWFDAAMDRVSGWYKRRTQWILTGLALAITVWANADTLVIANTLWRDPTMRAGLVEQAQEFHDAQKKLEAAPVASNNQQAQPAAQGPAPPPDRLPWDPAEQEYRAAEQNVQQLQSRIDELAIPLGWRASDGKGDPRETAPGDYEAVKKTIGHHLLGWLLTALAISLGAPFWFDMLDKVIAVRSTGKKPATDGQSDKK